MTTRSAMPQQVDPAALLEGVSREQAVRELAGTLTRRRGREPAVVRLGVVTATDDVTNTATVSIGGGDPIPGIPAASTYEPALGDKVTLLQTGSQYLIISAYGQKGRAARFAQDSAAATGSGTQSVTLSRDPIANSEHVYWNGLYQPGGNWTRSGRVVSITDPDGLIAAGDSLTVEYAYRGEKPPAGPAVFRAAAAGQAPAADRTWSMTLPAHGAGDLLLMWVARAPGLLIVTGGWTLQAHQESAQLLSTNATSNIYLYTRVADGTETEVAMSASDTLSGAQLAATVLVYEGRLVSVETAMKDPASSADTFAPPVANAPTSVAGVLYDGEGSSSETIIVTGGVERSSMIVNSGQWSMAASEGPATFADPVADTDPHNWTGIIVGLSGEDS